MGCSFAGPDKARLIRMQRMHPPNSQQIQNFSRAPPDRWPNASSTPSNCWHFPSIAKSLALLFSTYLPTNYQPKWPSMWRT